MPDAVNWKKENVIITKVKDEVNCEDCFYSAS